MRALPLALSTALLVFAAAAAVPAHAVTLMVEAGAPDPGPLPNERLVVGFDAANAPGFVWVTAPQTRAGSVAGVAAAPAGAIGRFGFVSTATGQPASAVLRTPLLRSISLLWGSVDKHNAVTVLGRNNAVLARFTGRDLPMANGSWSQGLANPRVGFVADHGEEIRGLRFDAGGVAFEFDSIAANANGVPEPASWAMLIAGFGLAGAVQRRRRARLAGIAPAA